MTTIFSEMSNQQLIEIYPMYQKWCETGFIEKDSILAEIRDSHYNQAMGVVTMQHDYLAECAERFFSNERRLN